MPIISRPARYKWAPNTFCRCPTASTSNLPNSTWNFGTIAHSGTYSCESFLIELFSLSFNGLSRTEMINSKGMTLDSGRVMWSCWPCLTPCLIYTSTHNSKGEAAGHLSLLSKTLKKLRQPILQSYACFRTFIITHVTLHGQGGPFLRISFDVQQRYEFFKPQTWWGDQVPQSAL